MFGQCEIAASDVLAIIEDTHQLPEKDKTEKDRFVSWMKRYGGKVEQCKHHR